VSGFSFERVIADRAYDSEAFLEYIQEQDADAVIPPRSNRTASRDNDRHLYKERHLIECFINKIKYFRRVFSRFDKLTNWPAGIWTFCILPGSADSASLKRQQNLDLYPESSLLNGPPNFYRYIEYKFHSISLYSNRQHLTHNLSLALMLHEVTCHASTQ